MDSSNDCTWPEIKQRAHYLCWLAAAIVTAALMGLTFDLLVVTFSGGTVGPGLVPLVCCCAIAAPTVYAWRKHGEACCGFLTLEHAMDESFARGVPARASAFSHVLELIERIEAARGMDRQLVRNEAKAWLLAHGDRLSRTERAYIADHLGYLVR